MYIRTFTFLALAIPAWAEHPLIGNWRMNLAKSTGVPTQISTFERDGEFLTNVNGSRTYKFKVDGKEYPVTGDESGLTASWAMIGRETYEHTMKKDGKVQYTVQTTFLSGGNRRIWSQSRVLENGTTVMIEAEQERVGGTIDRDYPLAGKWRLVPMARYEADGQGVRFRSGLLSFSAAFDGKDYPVIGSTAVDAVSLRVVDREMKVEAVFKKSGDVRSTSVLRVSPDGKILTSQTKGTRANGEAFASTAVFDRVP